MKTLKELREKKLTPAEKKKREEIAKAIEKDQPDMPMDKKMAIATAQAKKVAEAKMSAKSKEWYDKGYAMGKNPDTYKSPPFGIGGAAMDAFRKGRKDGESAKKESVELDEELWKDIETYANKHGGIDKKDMLKVAMMLKKGDRKGAVKYARGLDTDPRDWLLDKMNEGLDEAMSLSDIRRKKEREERRKKDGRAGETQAQRMQRKVYGNMMGGLKKGYGESVEHDLQESDSDKYRWKDINAALSGAGINPSTILRVLSGLRGKAIKEDLDEAMGPKPPKLKGNSGPYTRQQIEKAAKEAKVDIGAKSRMMMKLRDM